MLESGNPAIFTQGVSRLNSVNDQLIGINFNLDYD